MPTDTDLKLAEDLAAFRLESEKRFGSIEKGLSDSRADVREALAEIRADIREALAEMRGEFRDTRAEMRWIKRIGAFVVALMVSLAAGAVPVIWNAATIATDVRDHGRRLDRVEGRLDRVEKRLDSIDGKLDVLIRRAEGNATAKGQ